MVSVWTRGKTTLAISVGVKEALLVKKCFGCHWGYMTTNGYINLEIQTGEIERKKWGKRQGRKQVLKIYLESGTVLDNIKFQ